MLTRNKHHLSLLLILLSTTLSAQLSCPPRPKIQQKKILFERIFGSEMYYCINDIKSVSIKDKRIIGKWEVVKGRRKTTYYEREHHEEAKIFTYVREMDGIRTIEFKSDRTTIYTGDTALVNKMPPVFWAYLKPQEKIRGYGYDYESDSTEYEDLKGDGWIFQFQSHKGDLLIGYRGLEIQKLTRNKLVIGNIPEENDYSGYEITLRKVKRWWGRK